MGSRKKAIVSQVAAKVVVVPGSLSFHPGLGRDGEANAVFFPGGAGTRPRSGRVLLVFRNQFVRRESLRRIAIEKTESPALAGRSERRRSSSSALAGPLELRSLFNLVDSARRDDRSPPLPKKAEASVAKPSIGASSEARKVGGGLRSSITAPGGISNGSTQKSRRDPSFRYA